MRGFSGGELSSTANTQPVLQGNHVTLTSLQTPPTVHRHTNESQAVFGTGGLDRLNTAGK